MAKNKSAWGIEIGAHAIKAVRLERNGDEAAITDFACIPHNKPLTTPDLDIAEMTRLTLSQLVAAKDLEDQTIVISVPGHSALARFAKLPPVEPKMIPNIVKFEAVQQIPFPIEDVEWDYQTFITPDNPEVEVGIFAITKQRIEERLTLYAEFGIRPEIVTLGPLAVFNAVSYDLALPAEHKPVVVLDIGTQSSDVVVADSSRCWIRTFPLGGTHFTDALQSAFQISYGKADRLKAESATSKYARQMMQAMRPVFGDLVQEVQRSIGHYQMNHRESPLETVLAVGSTFRIPGLRKFLGQQLNVDIKRMDEFKRIRVEGREAADFAANSVNFVTAYGLALQGIGLSRISVNLAPIRGLREKVWAAKSKWFIAAVSIAVIGSAAMYVAPTLDRQFLDSGDVSKVSLVIQKGEQLQNQLKAANSAGEVGSTALNMERLLNDRKIWPCIVNDAVEATLSANPTDEVTLTDAAKIAAIPASERKRIVLEHLSGEYKFDEAGNKRSIQVTMDIEFANDGKKTFLKDSVQKWLRDNSDRGDKVPYVIIPDSIAIKGELTSVKMAGGDKAPDAKDNHGTDAPDTDVVGDASTGTTTSASGTTSSQGSSSSGSGATGRRKNLGDTVTTSSGNLKTKGGGAGMMGSPKAPSADPTTTPEADPEAATNEPLETASASNADLDKLAPIPNEPSVYGPGMTVYHGSIVFTVEIKDGAAKKGDGSEVPAKKPEGQPAP
ncbi:MAG: type IV pilus assembly protein PilM [Planctomycetes bacterium]|nr:type IV pilus assembly protein PilM [Planctomycetota bacterium]